MRLLRQAASAGHAVDEVAAHQSPSATRRRQRYPRERETGVPLAHFVVSVLYRQRRQARPPRRARSPCALAPGRGRRRGSGRSACSPIAAPRSPPRPSEDATRDATRPASARKLRPRLPAKAVAVRRCRTFGAGFGSARADQRHRRAPAAVAVGTQAHMPHAPPSRTRHRVQAKACHRRAHRTGPSEREKKRRDAYDRADSVDADAHQEAATAQHRDDASPAKCRRRPACTKPKDRS